MITLNAVGFLGFAALAAGLLLTMSLPAWKWALLAFGVLYLPYAFWSQRAAVLHPPRVDDAGVFLYRKPDLDYLMHGAHVPWANVRRVEQGAAGVLWVSYVAADGQARRDPVPTRALRNADAFRNALLSGAAANGVPVD
ncbi:hypothetical protein Deima_0779 [Deinococcus maricopensis DSM 21211]|uniref:Uncharacterized protein n=2 Tax=Deinococcus TaxID=1298 RepID=E8U5U6_DEIML|nr:hypothetical protein Deima_0779 [Deinococcus maricopensis DSM 21211]